MPQTKRTCEGTARAAKPEERSETILVVDDNAEVLAVVRAALDALGYKLLQARGPEEAVSVYERHLAERHGTIDLLLSDVVLKGASGLDLAARLRKRQRGLRVLYMSGFTGPGRAPLIQKPFTLEALALKVHEVLSRPPFDPAVP